MSQTKFTSRDTGVQEAAGPAMPRACNRPLSCILTCGRRICRVLSRTATQWPRSTSNEGYLKNQKDDSKGSPQTSDAEVRPGIRAHG